ncbi:MAG: hypothetical protein K0U41_02715 [Gammaproteobacteria bacterium]|nr:hypothetical protein [Gammaproteobacteria bacterium]
MQNLTASTGRLIASLILVTLLLAACGGGGGGSGGSSTTAPPKLDDVIPLLTELNSVPNGIILNWDNPAGVRNLTITSTSYATATAVTHLDTRVVETYTSRSRYLREGPQTLNFAAIPNRDRYYSYSITRGFDNNATDTLVSERLYLPPATINDARASLQADKRSVAIRWTNAKNILGIAEIRIGYWPHSTSNGPTASTPSFTFSYNDTSAIVSSNLTTTPAGFDTPPQLAENRYYSFTIMPIYTGGIAGRASWASSPQYIPPFASGTRTELNADSSEVTVIWEHRPSIPAIISTKITSQGYNAATGGNLDGDPVSVIYSGSSYTARRGSLVLSIGENGIVAGKHYSFTVTPIYAGGMEGLTSVDRSSRVKFLNRAGVRDLQAFPNDTAIRLTWANPLNVTGINITQTSGDTTTTLVDNSNDANLIRQSAQVVHDVAGLSANTSYTFSVTSIYTDNDAMLVAGVPVNITIRSLAAGSINDDLDAFNDDQDVDDDGNGLIELHNVDDLNMMRADLAGASLAGDSTGCGGVLDSDRNIITTCSGYELMAHVDLNDIEANLSKSNWEPIGACTIHNHVENCGTTAPAFSGTFDGNNYNISNLRIIITTAPFTPTHNIGFFRVTDASDLRNLVIRNASMSFTNSAGVYENIGLLVGAARATKISHSAIEFTEMDVYRGVDVGGFIGQASNSQIISSAVIGNRLTAANRVGGMVGGSLTGAVSISSSAAIIYNISDSGAPAIAAGLSTGFGGLYGAGANSKHRFTFSAAITHSIGSDSVRGAGGLASFISEQGLINASYVLSSNINSGGNISGIVAFADGGVASSYYNVTSFGSPPTSTEGIALNATGPQPSLQPANFTSTDAADFTAWANGWCDTTTGEFSQDPASALALSNGGANYAWKIGGGKFPVPACTPFSPDTLRTAISKVRNATNPVPIN